LTRDEHGGLVRPGAPPKGSDAMQAVLTHERFSDREWIYERKLDGIRCIAVRSGRRLTMLSRNDLSLNARFPELADALAGEPCERFALDGEVVAFERSRTSFARLAQRRHKRVPVFLYAFDLLWLDGEDWRPRPLLERKQRLARLISRHKGRLLYCRPKGARNCLIAGTGGCQRGDRAIWTSRRSPRPTQMTK
jgi:ATP-dependent DNA ligase